MKKSCGARASVFSSFMPAQKCKDYIFALHVVTAEINTD